ncbi:hypothetical protein PsYK624_153710 [Phanerochaete sordida]|uniref:Uncharacterized protein n=1 Tax=Phanerochaete sordida TaxID=48140 RepID=A0A9P3GP65_9APHY|nr:hypothetical protein PsYK624_153710 [Phanerochaete sordida]
MRTETHSSPLPVYMSQSSSSLALYSIQNGHTSTSLTHSRKRKGRSPPFQASQAPAVPRLPVEAAGRRLWLSVPHPRPWTVLCAQTQPASLRPNHAQRQPPRRTPTRECMLEHGVLAQPMRCATSTPDAIGTVSARKPVPSRRRSERESISCADTPDVLDALDVPTTYSASLLDEEALCQLATRDRRFLG